jgi:DNA-binding transcriptional regulator YiaG
MIAARLRGCRISTRSSSVSGQAKHHDPAFCRSVRGVCPAGVGDRARYAQPVEECEDGKYGGTRDMSESPAGRLRAARKAMGLSLSQLADLTGGSYSKSRISNYEQGIRRMPPAAAQALAKALGNVSAQVPGDYLLLLVVDSSVQASRPLRWSCQRRPSRCRQPGRPHSAAGRG